jgi:hypothetical protein
LRSPAPELTGADNPRITTFCSSPHTGWFFLLQLSHGCFNLLAAQYTERPVYGPMWSKVWSNIYGSAPLPVYKYAILWGRVWEHFPRGSVCISRIRVFSNPGFQFLVLFVQSLFIIPVLAFVPQYLLFLVTTFTAFNKSIRN